MRAKSLRKVKDYCFSLQTLSGHSTQKQYFPRMLYRQMKMSMKLSRIIFRIVLVSCWNRSRDDGTL